LALVLKLDFSEHEPGKVTLMHIDLPNHIVVGDDVAGLLYDWSTAKRTQHLIGVSIRNLILKFLTAMPGLRTLDCKPCPTRFETNANLATVKSGYQSVSEASASDRSTPPTIVGNQEFAFDFDRQSILYGWVSWSARFPDPFKCAAFP
jgi:hypothetical protein